ncbi:hypothetical protein BDV96DRAFT_646592 [Lophiotrema nucula]|uniref:Uncharacterized protein n=1 Tax=Lophiotrema nucula TaxID=690887 RepID=A0A6A5Z6R2_9PLEO|nr:hypothetical protein BDV96DRAFT_646592 [Lophiotrema nucula]
MSMTGMATAKATSAQVAASETGSSSVRPSTRKILSAMRDDFRRDRQLLRRDMKTVTTACKNKAIRQAQKVRRVFGSEKPMEPKVKKDRAIPVTTLNQVRAYEKPNSKPAATPDPASKIAEAAKPTGIRKVSDETKTSKAPSPGHSSYRNSSAASTEVTTAGGNSFNDVPSCERATLAQLPGNEPFQNPDLDTNSFKEFDQDGDSSNTSSELVDFTATMKQKVVNWYKSTHDERLDLPHEERFRLHGIVRLLLMIFELCFANPSYDQFRGGKADLDSPRWVACIREKASPNGGENILATVLCNFIIVRAEYPYDKDAKPILTATLQQKHRGEHDPPAAIFLWAALVAALDYRRMDTADAAEAVLRLVLPDQNVAELMQRLGSPDKSIRRLSEDEYSCLSDKLHAILDLDSEAIKRFQYRQEPSTAIEDKAMPPAKRLGFLSSIRCLLRRGPSKVGRIERS